MEHIFEFSHTSLQMHCQMNPYSSKSTAAQIWVWKLLKMHILQMSKLYIVFKIMSHMKVCLHVGHIFVFSPISLPVHYMMNPHSSSSTIAQIWV